MIGWTNFHMHTNYCDGKDTASAYLQRAKESGMASIGFSSHAPLPFECKWCMKPEKLPLYLQELNELREENKALYLYSGLEVDFIPGVIGPLDFRSDLDYTIGSVHFVDAFDDGRRWEIDGLHTLFLEGYEQIFNRNIQSVIGRYYSLTREMINNSCPDVVGHLDKIKIQNVDEKFFSETEPWYRKEIDNTLDVIGRAGAIIEVNTRGLYQKKSATPYPSPWVLEMIHKKNIPVTLSSDAHHPDDIVNQFGQTAELLLTIGFKKISALRNGHWKPFDLTTHGIDLS